MQLPLVCPLLRTWPAAQACALTGNQTSDPLVRRLTLNPLSRTSQGDPLLSTEDCLLTFLSLLWQHFPGQGPCASTYSVSEFCLPESLSLSHVRVDSVLVWSPSCHFASSLGARSLGTSEPRLGCHLQNTEPPPELGFQAL